MQQFDEEEDTASTIAAVTANITSANQILFETKSGGIDAITTLLVRSLKRVQSSAWNVSYDFEHSSDLPYKERNEFKPTSNQCQ